MLTITTKDTEDFNELTGEFISIKGKTIQLEHSLLSISKWESKWKKSFLHTEDKTPEQILDYIKCMTLTPNIDDSVYTHLDSANLATIKAYIEDPMTATVINDRSRKQGMGCRDIVTSELIYYWMVEYGIPFECQKWHINRLLTLIQVYNVKNGDGKKMSKKEVLAQNKALNAARRAKTGSKG